MDRWDGWVAGGMGGCPEGWVDRWVEGWVGGRCVRYGRIGRQREGVRMEYRGRYL